MVEEAGTQRNASRLFAGLVIISLGALALLDNFGVIHIRNIWRFWPLVLVAIGLSKLLRPRGSPGRLGGAIFFGVGMWLLLENLGVWPYDLGDLWPLFIILVGAWLVWGAWGRGLRPPTADVSTRMSSFVILGGTEHHNNSPDFQGGDATAILGGCKVDLRQAGIKGGEAVIDAFALWGGVELLVPREWSVILRGTPILGSFEDKRGPSGEGTGPRLIVRGAAIMGGVEIKS
jgi:predicted membrane protein